MRFQNIRATDRIVRVTLGCLLLTYGWLAPTAPFAILSRIVALYPLITGVFGWCPAYALLQLLIASRRRKKESNDSIE